MDGGRGSSQHACHSCAHVCRSTGRCEKRAPHGAVVGLRLFDHRTCSPARLRSDGAVLQTCKAHRLRNHRNRILSDANCLQTAFQMQRNRQTAAHGHHHIGDSCTLWILGLRKAEEFLRLSDIRLIVQISQADHLYGITIYGMRSASLTPTCSLVIVLT